MVPEDEVARLLSQPGARASVFDPTGGSTVPMPDHLAGHGAVVIGGASPLDQIEAGSHASAVVAYEQARRRGRGSAEVVMVGDDGPSRLDIFDLEQRHGCFVAIVTGAGDDQPDAAEQVALTPRQASYRLNVTGVIEAISPAFTAMLGWEPDEVIGMSSLDLIHPDDHEDGVVAWIEMLAKPGSAHRMRQRFKSTDGQWRWCEVTDTNHLDDPDRGFVLGELLDVSREMAAQAALQRRETLLDRLSRSLPSGVLHLEVDGTVTVCNDRWTELTGLSADDGLDPLVSRVTDRDALAAAITAASNGGEDHDVDVQFVDGDGSCRFGQLHLRPLTEGEEPVGLLVTLDDVTTLRAYQIEIDERLRRDTLTGAYNRLGVEEWMDAMLADESELAILFLDLDRFKLINDTHGHAVGDQVLRRVAECVSDLLRPEDELGRLGGDEFLVMLGGPSPHAAAAEVAARIRAAVPRLADGFGQELEIGVSVGLAVAEDADRFDSLLRRADEAMYQAKQRAGSPGSEPEATAVRPAGRRSRA